MVMQIPTDAEMIKKRRKKSREDVLDEYESGGGFAAKTVPTKGNDRAGGAVMAGAQAAAGGGSVMDVGSSAAMASGDQYLMGAALGMQVLSAKEKREAAEARQAEELKYQAAINKKQAQESALQNLVQVSDRLRML